MPSSPKLPKLPSTKELLAHPKVKSVIEQVSQSTVATRAAEFYEDLRSTVSEKASSFELPSLPSLAEQFARRLLGDSESSGAAINATGMIVGGELAAPIPEAAVHAMLAAAGDYRRSGESLQTKLQKQVSALAVAEDALITSSRDSALYLTIASLATQGELHVTESLQQSAHDWQRLASSCGAALRTREFANSSVENVLTIGCSRLSNPTAKAETPGHYVELASAAGFLNPSDFGYSAIPPLSNMITDGTDLVITAGNGLIGGPSCGIIAGGRALVERIRSHPLTKTLAASELDSLALKATLDLYKSADEVPFTVPVWQLLSTPVENLQLRAERLAQLINVQERVGHAVPRQIESAWMSEHG
ncbi:MAG: hypothetical protein RID07_17810, partial [Lacipirellulaceae bacterium]